MRPVVDPDVGSNRLGPGAVDDEAVADREVDAHRGRRAARRGLDVDASVRDHDAVALARRGDRHLPVQDVGENGGRVALERRAEAAAPGGDVREAVALVERAAPPSASSAAPGRSPPETTTLLDGAPGSPPSSPYGGWSRRSVRIVSVALRASTRYSRTYASPPRCRPAPPESGTTP